MSLQFKALSVHLLTATGAVLAMLAMLAAVEAKWDMMFLWLVVAFIVDGVDGPLARRYEVKTFAPQYDGMILDMIVDYLTYIFIPAFALFKSGLLPDWTGWICILVITYTSALYMVDKRMKTKDNSFSGFPATWNMLVLVIFATEPNFWVVLFIVVACAITMFTSLKFIHPVRTERWRWLSLPVAIAWTILAGMAAWTEFHPGPLVTVLIAATSIYLLCVGIIQEMFPQKTADLSQQ
jgi:phosphatidylcholine synthase